MGREAHLAAHEVPNLPIAVPFVASPPAEEPEPNAPILIQDERTDITERRRPAHPHPSGKSGFPSLARFFGRWTTQGDFAPQSQGEGRDDLMPARDTTLRNILLVLGVALLSFLVVSIVARVTGC